MDTKLGGIEIPATQRNLISSISEKAGGRGGCFDVFVWRDDQVLFCESKRQGQDQLRKTQKRWMDGAIAAGVQETSLLVVEWSPAS